MDIAQHDPAAVDAPDPLDRPLAEFEHCLHAHIAEAGDDQRFWHQVAHDLHRMEAGMDAVQVGRFEIAVDGLLSRLGLPAWSVTRALLPPEDAAARAA
jgi:hypothetical protein